MTQFTDKQLLETTKRVTAKLRAFQDGLAEEERLVFGLAARRLVGGAEADAQGYMKPVYDNGQGNKGRPGAGGQDEPGGLIPYQTMGPTVSNGYLFPNGNTVPSP